MLSAFLSFPLATGLFLFVNPARRALRMFFYNKGIALNSAILALVHSFNRDMYKRHEKKLARPV